MTTRFPAPLRHSSFDGKLKGSSRRTRRGRSKWPWTAHHRTRESIATAAGVVHALGTLGLLRSDYLAADFAQPSLTPSPPPSPPQRLPEVGKDDRILVRGIEKRMTSAKTSYTLTDGWTSGRSLNSYTVDLQNDDKWIPELDGLLLANARPNLHVFAILSVKSVSSTQHDAVADLVELEVSNTLF